MIVSPEISSYRKILNAHSGRRIQPDIAMNPAEAPHVLILKITPIAKPVNLDRDQVFPRPNKRRNIKLRRRHTALTVANAFAIHPNIERALHAVEVNKYPTPFPRHRHLKSAAIGADGVTFLVRRIVRRRFARHAWRINFKNVTTARIHRRAIAIDLPVGWHWKRLPFFVIKRRFVEVHRPLFRPRHPIETPRVFATQRQIPRRFLDLALTCLLNRGKRHKGRPGRLTIDLDDLLVFPIRRSHSPVCREDNK